MRRLEYKGVTINPLRGQNNGSHFPEGGGGGGRQKKL